MKILIYPFIFSLYLFAQEHDPSGRIPQYFAEGAAVALRVVPQDKTARVYLMGRKAVDMDFKKKSKVLSVTLNSKNPGELRINQKGEYYEIEGLPNSKDPYELSIRTETQGQLEDIKVKINSPAKP